jgi:glycosyltransferase involved in cell wall biosynthesis
MKVQPAPKGPLVTFALFAFNQEQYIREAIQGAFAQTYKPLEIILSDDCSTDRTFEIMQEMASDYRGPHRVEARQTKRNLRPYSHVLDVSAISRGELMVLAAADDVSVPTRVSELYDAWRATGAWGLHSRYDVIDDSSAVVARGQRSASLVADNCELRTYFFPEDGPVQVVHGATSAYDRRLFQIAPDDEAGILSEDGVFTILLNRAGKPVEFVDRALVRYRQHSGAITNFRLEDGKNGLADCRALLEREKIYSGNIVSRGHLALRTIGMSQFSVRRLNSKAVWHDIRLHQAKCAWSTLGWLDRLHAVAIAVRRKRFGFLLPSILGDQLGPKYLALRNRAKMVPRRTA